MCALLWGGMPVLVKKQSQVGEIEHVDLVACNDPHWKVESDVDSSLRVCHISDENRNEHLKKQ